MGRRKAAFAITLAQMVAKSNAVAASRKKAAKATKKGAKRTKRIPPHARKAAAPRAKAMKTAAKVMKAVKAMKVRSTKAVTRTKRIKASSLPAFLSWVLIRTEVASGLKKPQGVPWSRAV